VKLLLRLLKSKPAEFTKIYLMIISVFRQNSCVLLNCLSGHQRETLIKPAFQYKTWTEAGVSIS